MVIPSPRPQTRPISLAELFPGHPSDVSVTGVVMDSRVVLPGDLYVAVGGANVHGARFAEAVAEAGAAAILTDAAGADLVAASAAAGSVELIVVADPRALAGEVASRVYGHPSRSMLVVGITGTNGKTTMSFLIESVLAAAGHVTGVMGTTGHRVAGRLLQTERTTPEAVDVHAILGHMRDEGVTAVVMEVSSHAMAFGRVNAVEFDAAVFTNLTQDHLDFHGTMADYFEAKATLFTMASHRVICLDDSWGEQLATRWPTAVTYAVTGVDADWTVADVQPDDHGSDFLAKPPEGEPVPCRVGLPGVFNVANALGALATAVAVEVPLQVAAVGVRACPGVPGRMQSVFNQRGIRAFVDYAHTPDAVERAIIATHGRVIAVLGCGGDRDASKRPLMGEAAARLADVVVVTDDNPRSEDPALIRAAMLAGVSDVPDDERAEVHEIGDRQAAIRAAVALAGAGDAVLVLGKGHEQGQQVGSVTHHFDDVEELAAALEDVAQ